MATWIWPKLGTIWLLQFGKPDQQESWQILLVNIQSSVVSQHTMVHSLRNLYAPYVPISRTEEAGHRTTAIIIFYPNTDYKSNQGYSDPIQVTISTNSSFIRPTTSLHTMQPM